MFVMILYTVSGLSSGLSSSVLLGPHAAFHTVGILVSQWSITASCGDRTPSTGLLFCVLYQGHFLGTDLYSENRNINQYNI